MSGFGVPWRVKCTVTCTGTCSYAGNEEAAAAKIVPPLSAAPTARTGRPATHRSYPPVGDVTQRRRVHPTQKDTPMASSRRKSAAIALAVVGIAGLSLASAATLNINASALGAGTEVVASCDADGVKVGFTTVYATAGYQANAITVSGIDAVTCLNQQIRVTVADGSTVVLADATDVIGAGETSLTFPFTAYDAEGIDSVSIVIAG